MISIISTLILVIVYILISNLQNEYSLNQLSSDSIGFMKKISYPEEVFFILTDHLTILAVFSAVFLFAFIMSSSKHPKFLVQIFKIINLKLLPIYQLTRILSCLCWPMREVIPFNSLYLVPLIIPISLIKTKFIRSIIAETSGEMNIISRSILQVITIICSCFLLFLIPFLQSYIKKTYLSSL